MLMILHRLKRVQLVLGLLAGIAFGFLLQKGGVTRYDVIVGQLLFEDFTVLKVMLSAVIVGMVGVHLLRSLGLAELHPKPGSLGATAVGGLLFGLGFGLLGYCPGTVAGAVGNGHLDALVGGVTGMLVGTGLFAVLYPRLQDGILKKGDFGELTIPQFLKVNAWAVVLPAVGILVALLALIERTGG
ncbi:MAG: YeeE/YedE family protein [Candidatus Brocadiaceae bacterium]|nr:YeeE/YedE family protein [Candidatus Brocadiaceae bacterium]